VGNVLNSVNVSSTLVTEQLRKSRLPGLSKAAALLREQEHDLPGFFASDPRAKQLPGYLAMLAERLEQEQASVINESHLLSKHIAHIKEIVAMQQTYAKASGVSELLPPADLVEDALRMNAAALVRHDVELLREFAPTPCINVDRHKVLSILINLISNAKYAMDAQPAPTKVLRVKIDQPRPSRVQITVSDNGVGIAAENLTRVFEHGFTTKKNGHGFGLHSSAIAAKELGGSLTVESAGLGQGAAFILELPVPTSPIATIDSPGL
jgi:C4-dicarboxylate-specific signal transduction histidine kinase